MGPDPGAGDADRDLRGGGALMAHSSFDPRCDTSKIKTLVRKDGLRLPVHVELVDLFAILLDLTEAVGVDVRPGETWGYACRNIRGTSTPSNHSWGTAIDVNAPANPYASASYHSRYGNTTVRGKKLRTEFNDDIVRMWERHQFRWGGWYKSNPDPMHFEFMGSVADARRQTKNLHDFFASKSGSGGSKPKPKPKPSSGSNLEFNMNTLDLSAVTNQRSTWITDPHMDQLQALSVPILKFVKKPFGKLLGADGAPDGQGGPGTAQALEEVQKAMKFFGKYDGPIDRICGDGTWKAIIEF